MCRDKFKWRVRDNLLEWLVSAVYFKFLTPLAAASHKTIAPNDIRTCVCVSISMWMWCHNQLRRAEVSPALKRVYFGCFQLLREKKYFWRSIFLSINLICLSVVSFGREFSPMELFIFLKKGTKYSFIIIYAWGRYFRHKLPIEIDRYVRSGDALKNHSKKRWSLDGTNQY